MKIKLTKQDIISLLEKYYSDMEGVDTKVLIKVSKDYVGYGMNEYEDAIIDISRESSIEIFGKKYNSKINISEEEIKEVFKSIIESQGYEYVNFKLLYGLDTKTVGYCIGEETISTAKFNGAELIVNKKNKVKKIKMKEGDYI